MRYAFDDDPTSCDMPPYIYGGTTLNVMALGEGEAWIITYGLIDLPFSLVADTLLLPVSIPMQINNSVKSDCGG